MTTSQTINQNPAENVGFNNYYLQYIRLYAWGNSELAQQLLDKIIKDIPYIDNPETFKKAKFLFNLCLSKGAKLNLPTLKVKGRRIKKDIENWIYDFDKKEIIEDVKIYDFLISNQKISSDDKCKMDSILLQSMMADLILLNYNKNLNYFSKYVEQKYNSSHALNAQYSALTEVEYILHRGHVFNNQISRFLALSSIFGYREIFDNLSTKFKLICYQEFEKLSVIGKKALTSLLVKNKNEEAIFNLLNYGLKLNWDITVEDGKKNLVAFEMLHSLQWVKAIVEHNSLDIRQTNSRGENILHLIGVCALEDSSIEYSLRRKINEYSHEQKNNLFFQVNEEGLTPLMKAVVFQDEKLIDFISEFNIKPWDELKGAPSSESALDFLNNHILTSTKEGPLGSLIDYFKDSFWMVLAKKWNSEYYYLKLQSELSISGSKKKAAKI